jgi:hypothetical protein
MALLCLLVTACSGGGDNSVECRAPPAVAEVNCSATGSCNVIQIAGDAPHNNPGTFKGFADPSLASDPDVAGRVWLAYTWPHVVAGQALDGSPVQMAAAENRLARSDDGGATFALVGTLWPDVPIAEQLRNGIPCDDHLRRRHDLVRGAPALLSAALDWL